MDIKNNKKILNNLIVCRRLLRKRIKLKNMSFDEHFNCIFSLYYACRIVIEGETYIDKSLVLDNDDIQSVVKDLCLDNKNNKINNDIMYFVRVRKFDRELNIKSNNVVLYHIVISKSVYEHCRDIYSEEYLRYVDVTKNYLAKTKYKSNKLNNSIINDIENSINDFYESKRKTQTRLSFNNMNDILNREIGLSDFLDYRLDFIFKLIGCDKEIHDDIMNKATFNTLCEVDILEDMNLSTLRKILITLHKNEISTLNYCVNVIKNTINSEKAKALVMDSFTLGKTELDRKTFIIYRNNIINELERMGTNFRTTSLATPEKMIAGALHNLKLEIKI